MKKAVITSLGTATCEFNGEKSYAEYFFEDENISLKKKEYTNMLPIMIEKYSDEYDIVTLYTEKAKQAQMEVLKSCEENVKMNDNEIEAFFEKGVLINEDDFNVILKVVDSKIKEYDEVILDVTHGFRHLPILVFVDAIIRHLKEPNKIKAIWFAQEIIPHSKYKIVNLYEYLELSQFITLINIFLSNYTIGKDINFSNEKLNKLKISLSKFSEYLLSNSIYELIKQDGVIDEISNELLEIKNDEKIELFKDEIEEISNYILDIKKLYQSDKKNYEKHFFITKEMFDRFYYVNSLTFLIEAISYLTKDILIDIDNNLGTIFEKERSYNVLNDSKNFIMNKNFNPKFAKMKYFKDKENIEKLKEKLNNYQKIDISRFSRLIRITNEIRNSWAHINMSESKFLNNEFFSYKENRNKKFNNFRDLIKELCIDEFDSILQIYNKGSN